tara:strand:+ start:248 stop:919 length:672 start_codon:yes stop_codon:yes gene_type:complete
MHFLHRLFSLKNLIVFYILISFLTFAQSENLLIQQYNKGPALDDVYSKWSIYIGSRLNYLNTDLNGTNPLLSLGGLTEVQLNISKSFGFIIGFGNTAISYRYDYLNSFAKDRLDYFVLPIGVRLNPTKKVSFSFGTIYNFFNKGLNQVAENDIVIKKEYEKIDFENSFGGFTQIGFYFLKNFYGFINYRWATKYNSPLVEKSNNNNGFQLGLAYKIWSSKTKR